MNPESSFVSLDRVPGQLNKFEVCFKLTAPPQPYMKFKNSEPAIREALEQGGMPQTEIDFHFELAKKAAFHCEQKRWRR